jgi:hypothetical protein
LLLNGPPSFHIAHPCTFTHTFLHQRKSIPTTSSREKEKEREEDFSTPQKHFERRGMIDVGEARCGTVLRGEE